MSVSRYMLPLLISVLLALAACGRDAPSGDGATAGPDDFPDAEVATDGDFERAWLGVLPCADCDGIQTRLVLRAEDGVRRYVLEETYLGAEGDNAFVQEGEWREETTSLEGVDTTVYRLDPQGPGRWFWLQPDGGLEMLEGEGRASLDGLAYRLQRL
ncbi:copper resistance protein NlpE [Arenimonas daejeonensis]|uniref:copper resistance protein NlpE n=1 Tax=Arenimonas daejeonensis TaxID=370777 RepID=UPI001315A807|nr:copper resistance protein NlpE [Arenimonas daejeonensis]